MVAGNVTVEEAAHASAALPVPRPPICSQKVQRIIGMLRYAGNGRWRVAISRPTETGVPHGTGGTPAPVQTQSTSVEQNQSGATFMV